MTPLFWMLSKFIHYRPKVLVLNNFEFDHGDIFRDPQDTPAVSRTFFALFLPMGLFSKWGRSNLWPFPLPLTKIISVGVERRMSSCDFMEDAKVQDLVSHGKEIPSCDRLEYARTFNARNLAMASLASVLSQQICKASKPFDFEGNNPFQELLPIFRNVRVKRRQGILHESEQLVVLSDFAHHPTAIAGALESLRARWSGREIIACFEPRSNTAVTNVFEDRFADALALADVGLLGAVHRAEKIPEDKRINTRNMIQRIKDQGKSSHAFSPIRNSRISLKLSF